MTIAAKYENGVLRPLEDVKIKEGTVVEVLVPTACTQAALHQRSSLLRHLEGPRRYRHWRRLREQAQG